MATQFSIQDNKPWKTTFFTIWGGQALSLLGSQLVQFALIWHLTITTGSATVLATASLVGMLPGVILGPFVGTLVDRWNRRIIMLLADSLIALATIVLAVLFALDAMRNLAHLHRNVHPLAGREFSWERHECFDFADGTNRKPDPHPGDQPDAHRRFECGCRTAGCSPFGDTAYPGHPGH